MAMSSFNRIPARRSAALTPRCRRVRVRARAAFVHCYRRRARRSRPGVDRRRPHGPDGSLTRQSARDRILSAAHDYFHNVGIRATGVDTLIEAAGVAKATFYRHFPSKDDLVVAWLCDSRPRWFYRIRDEAEDVAPRPEELIPLIFESVARWIEEDGFRGCAFLNAAVEITGSVIPRGRSSATTSTKSIPTCARRSFAPVARTQPSARPGAQRLAGGRHRVLRRAARRRPRPRGAGCRHPAARRARS